MEDLISQPFLFDSFPTTFWINWIWMTRPLFVDSIPLQSRGLSNHVKSTIHNRSVSELFPIDRGLSPLLTVDRDWCHWSSRVLCHFAAAPREAPLHGQRGGAQLGLSRGAHGPHCAHCIETWSIWSIWSWNRRAAAGTCPGPATWCKEKRVIDLCPWQRWIVLFRHVKTQDWTHSWYTAAVSCRSPLKLGSACLSLTKLTRLTTHHLLFRQLKASSRI